MADHSFAFAESTQPLPDTLDVENAERVLALAHRGFEVRQGLTAYYAGSVAVMALQPHIKRVCPNDATDARFGSEASTAEWLNKDGGRNMFVLLKDQERLGQRLVGYGWTGPATVDELPGSETTFAVRLGKEAVGKHLSLSFTSLIIAGSREMFGSQNFWLETWESNQPAVATYKKAGFEIVQAMPEIRGKGRQKKYLDARLFMTLS